MNFETIAAVAAINVVSTTAADSSVSCYPTSLLKWSVVRNYIVSIASKKEQLLSALNVKCGKSPCLFGAFVRSMHVIVTQVPLPMRTRKWRLLHSVRRHEDVLRAPRAKKQRQTENRRAHVSCGLLGKYLQQGEVCRRTMSQNEKYFLDLM